MAIHTEPFTGTGALSAADWLNMLNSHERDTDNGVGVAAAAFNVSKSLKAGYAADQYAQVIPLSRAGSTRGGVCLRLTGTATDGSDLDGYYAFVDTDGVSIEIGAFTNGDPGAGLGTRTAGVAFNGTSDVLKASIEGTTIKVYKNDVQVGADLTDATYATGNAGIITFSANYLDDFESDNLSSPPAADAAGLSGYIGGVYRQPGRSINVVLG